MLDACLCRPWFNSYSKSARAFSASPSSAVPALFDFRLPVWGSCHWSMRVGRSLNRCTQTVMRSSGILTSVDVQCHGLPSQGPAGIRGDTPGRLFPSRLLAPLALPSPFGLNFVAVVEDRGCLAERPGQPDHVGPAGQALPLLVRPQGGDRHAGAVRQPLLRQPLVPPQLPELLAKAHASTLALGT